MKPFDKEAFLNGAVAINEEGREVKYLTTLRGSWMYPIVVCVCDGSFEEDGVQRINHLTEDFLDFEGDTSPYLVGMKSVKKTYYVALGERLTPDSIYASHARSDKQGYIDAGYPEHRIFSIEVEE